MTLKEALDQWIEEHRVGLEEICSPDPHVMGGVMRTLRIVSYGTEFTRLEGFDDVFAGYVYTVIANPQLGGLLRQG